MAATTAPTAAPPAAPAPLRRARAALGLRVVEVLLLLAGALAALAAALHLVGPNGAGWFDGGGLPQTLERLLGPLALVPGATIALDVPVVVPDAPTLADAGSRGTVDAATGLPPVELGGPYLARLTFLGLDLQDQWLYVLQRALGPLLLAAGLLVLWRLVRATRIGPTPFTAANARRVRRLALLVGVGGTALSAFSAWLQLHLVEGSAGAGIAQQGWAVSYVPLAAGLLLGVLALVWRHGVRLQQDLEGLV